MLLHSDSYLNGLEPQTGTQLEYLLIQRKDSLGFIDILRGKYRPNDYEYVSQQLRGMTRDEQQRLLTLPFETLWEQLWGPPTEGSNSYRHEKEQSRMKLEGLRKGSPSLEELIQGAQSNWPSPEWGFPKGRREPHETEYACALREMWEETGLTENDVIPVKNMEAIRETFFGSNRIQYCHKYYILYVPPGVKEVAYDPTNEHMKREIGDIRWCSLESALALIRHENVEKREVLLRVSRLLRNYCPFQIGDLAQ